MSNELCLILLEIFTERPVNEAIKSRARSNSVESWSAALKVPSDDGPKRHSSIHDERKRPEGKNRESTLSVFFFLLLFDFVY